jgi:uncharacterized repeat protein (TIGR04138 family)
MPTSDFDTAVDAILARDSRFSREAYYLVRDGLAAALRHLPDTTQKEIHVRGPVLCDGVRQHALDQFGPMVPTLMEFWGLRSTRDIGEIVFLLIAEKAFSASPEDCLDDFENVFDFQEAFVKPFLPKTVNPLDKAQRSDLPG